MPNDVMIVIESEARLTHRRAIIEETTPVHRVS